MSARSGWAAAVLSLLACGGHALAAPAAASAPGGLYVGYYQEDPLTNPEDPTPGAFVLTLPERDAAFDGSMFFTYVGCQTSNVGSVKGVKAGNALSGTWSGVIDGSAESGPYSGAYEPAFGGYKGVYTVALGKQYKEIAGCIRYYIAPNGRWEMFPIEHSQPATFQVAVAGLSASWPAVADAAMSLVYVVDPAIAQGGGNPVRFQTILPGAVTSYDLASARLTHGKTYVFAALVTDARSSRVAFSSRRFVAP